MTQYFKSVPVKAFEITPKSLYLSRRDFIKAAGIVTGAAALAACAPQLTGMPQPTSFTQTIESSKKDELGNPVNTIKDITNYNNYYEFTPDKTGVAYVARNFKTSPWDVEVYGLVNKPKKYAVEDLIKKFQPDEHIYRLRCVEGWSMVIPWVGFPLTKLLKEAEPTSDAKFVRFETLLDKERMRNEGSPYFPWPYQEGLRLDEAMNELVILANGLYGGELPAQNGGGLRLVVPWKYGFKSIKAIVKIELVEKRPETFWSTVAPREYGFFANVNPQVDHPRWSQSTERRIGELSRRETLMFNGYDEQVAALYQNMDLKYNY
jgi:methionine sulfoxide reductase catalytic subunit